MRALALAIALLPSLAMAVADDLETQHFDAIPGSCIAASDPGACMASNGYRCNKIAGTRISVDAFYLGCNARMSNGRVHFAQLLFDGTGWVIEQSRAYVPEPVVEQARPSEPEAILDTYLREQVDDRHWLGGGVSGFHLGAAIVVHTEYRKQADPPRLRGLCGVLLGNDHDEGLQGALQAECERRVLRTIRNLSQQSPDSPFRAAGANALEWVSLQTKLESGDAVQVLEAHYRFPEGHVACRMLPYCCTGNTFYLESCRDMTDRDKEAINTCLAQDVKPRSDEFVDCLRSAGVQAGCEDQPDGSRLCY